MWHGDQLDLDAYLARLGYEGQRTPALETLRALHRAHVLTVRWGNLDCLVHGSVPLDLAQVQDKLVRRGQGGYCFEHVVLYAAALERLGFTFTAASGRPRMGADRIRPATHAMVLVTVEGRRWLSDIGFGTSPLDIIELVDGSEPTIEGRRFWLRHTEVTPGAEGWMLHQQDADGGWMARHTFTEDPQYPADYVLGNHFIATSSHSPFNRRPFLQRVRPDRTDQLDGLTWTTTAATGLAPEEERTVEPSELPKLFADPFGIDLSEEDARLLVDHVERGGRSTAPDKGAPANRPGDGTGREPGRSRSGCAGPPSPGGGPW
ncbi:arylamine N-acetyltransferase family protein [Streptomyces reniochalinae]|uniref:Arylamine N-acetyltransferase n=1 Tax=Streptomyces reniochalinae TaxID=2250578 RepID=A0A367ENL6_9ACTN|nr:arylamine N-acetyltransferase [Streptomyces reniochalinae]RCG19349.1 arylamine N-acetyltransferase [Streptomyces reniochalinae]